MLSQSIYTGRRVKILIVDDNATTLHLLEHIIRSTEYDSHSADSGEKALAYLRENPQDIDILLLDRIMPGIDGIQVCREMKNDENLRNIPIVMQTAASDPTEISQGLEAGVFYYLTKPLNPDTLISVLKSATRETRQFQQLRQEMVQRQASYSLIDRMACSLKSLEEVADLSTFLANLFPDPDRSLVGISEILINAVEHGNLEIDYDLKSELNADNILEQEVARRLVDPILGARKVRIKFSRNEKECVLQVADEGQGFLWHDFLAIDPSRVLHNHGRGIAMAKMLSFDKLVYNEKGNVVTCTVYP